MPLLGASGVADEHRARTELRRATALAVALSAASLLACAPAGAAIYFRSATTAQTASGASSIALAVPSGVVAGDVLIASIDAEGSGTFTAPSGWSSTSLFAGTINTGYTGVYYHVAGSSEPASYTWTLGSSRKATGKMAAYVGVENSSPIEVTSTKAGGPNGPSDNAASLTTTVAKTMVLLDFAALNPAGSFTITPPGGTSARASVFTSGTGSVLGSRLDDFVQATAGATPTETYKPSVSIAWGEVTSALKPGTGTLAFDVAPQTPALASVTLKGEAQTTTAQTQMNAFAVDDTTGSGAGWKVTVAGNSGTGKSAVFKQYCSNGAEPCGGTAANSYVSGGATLPAGSLQLSTSGASWSTNGGSGTTPAFQCTSSTCPLDAASATKIVSASTSAGPWASSALSATSLKLSTPSTLGVLPANEAYRVDLLWTLSSGP